MSSITAANNSNFGMESLALSMTKRSNDQNGKMAMSLLTEAVASTQQIQAQGAQALAQSGNIGTNINIKV